MVRASSRRAGARAALFAAVTVAASCGAAHIRLVNEGSEGPLYECDQSACRTAQTDDPARTNLGRTDFYELPDGCVELASAVLRPSGPGVDVACGPPNDRSKYRCESSRCALLDGLDDDATTSTMTIHLPEDCGGRIHEILVIDAREGSPTVYVQCDASSDGLGNM